MSTATTIRMLAAYLQMASPTMFLSGFFQSPPRNFHNSEDVEIDIVRGQEDVAVVLTDLSTGYRMNETDIFSNKRLKPPIFKEAVSISAFTLLDRVPGDTPFQDPSYRGNLIARMFSSVTQIEAKIRRSIEQQCAQVLQTGIITLSDSGGVDLYTLDYLPKAAHFPTTSNAWDGGGATIAPDISSLAEVIRGNGLADPNQLIMGINAFEAFIADADIQKRFDNRRINQGAIEPMAVNGEGGAFRGVVDIGNYKYDIWTYGGRFKDAQTGVSTQYLTPSSCIVRVSDARMDLTFGNIPNIGRELGVQALNLLPELPGRIRNVEGGLDLFLNAWLSPDGEQMFAGVGARPLAIPVAIDTFGNIDTLT